MIMWKWVGPIVMFVIFFASVILELIDPLKYTVYLNVRMRYDNKNTSLIRMLNHEVASFRIIVHDINFCDFVHAAQCLYIILKRRLLPSLVLRP